MANEGAAMKEVAQTCALCGKPSCEDHVHLSPVEYSHLVYDKERQ